MYVCTYVCKLTLQNIDDLLAYLTLSWQSNAAFVTKYWSRLLPFCSLFLVSRKLLNVTRYQCKYNSFGLPFFISLTQVNVTRYRRRILLFGLSFHVGLKQLNVAKFWCRLSLLTHFFRLAPLFLESPKQLTLLDINANLSYLAYPVPLV